MMGTLYELVSRHPQLFAIGGLFCLYPLAMVVDALNGQSRNDDGTFEEKQATKVRRLYFRIGMAVLLLIGGLSGRMLGLW